MNKASKILSDITVHMKYAKFLPRKRRRETYEELVTRNKNMHIKKYPQLKGEINEAYKYVYDKKILPSMRSMQFGGKPIAVAPNRIFNCAYLPIDDVRAFGEIMFLLLGGTGVGYSVQAHHVEELPEIVKPSGKRTYRYLIGDSIEGWALVTSYFRGTSKLRFDFSDIRPKGSRLVTSGGKAPGPQPLKECLVKLEGLLEAKENGDKLRPIEVHDMVCHIADAVLAGGIRRAALISLFSADDDEMISSKTGGWWEKNPQRGRANNSVVLMRHIITKEFFMDLWHRVKASGAGEPGFYFTYDKDWGTNPCCEIALRPFQFCNLTEVNVSNVASQEDFEARVRAAAFIGTLQASYTDFHYLRGTSSGIHAWHAPYYIRRLRVGKNEAIYKYLEKFHPELVEDEYFRPHDTAIIQVPQKAPEDSILRSESALKLLRRVKRISTQWVKPGHGRGQNMHNVSATITIKENEWDRVGEWMWENRSCYNGLSVLPHDGGTYTQAPFEECDELTYARMMKSLAEIDLTNIVETQDDTDLQGELACAGGVCEIR